MLGFGQTDTDTLRRWFHGLSGGFSNAALTPEGFAVSDATSAEITSVLQPMVDRLRTEPDHSGLSHWLHDGMPAGRTRSLEDLLPSFLVTVLGGMQEPAHGAGSTLLGLLSRPAQLARVVADHQLIPTAVTEGLRWCAPIWTAIGRSPRHPVERAGVSLAAGDHLLLSYGSANWDEREFERAEVYDLDRPKHPHLAFGAGVHSCAGSAFAQHVIRIAFEELLVAIPSVELDPERASTVGGWVFRGPRELNVRWTA